MKINKKFVSSITTFSFMLAIFIGMAGAEPVVSADPVLPSPPVPVSVPYIDGGGFLRYRNYLEYDPLEEYFFTYDDVRVLTGSTSGNVTLSDDPRPTPQPPPPAAVPASQNDGWYIVRSNYTVNGRLFITGDVHIILEDGCHLNAINGIDVSGANSLTVYAQTTSRDSMGRLTAQNGGFPAAIGGNNNMDSGAITINGGIISATGSQGAGIGGGRGGDGGTITVNGGYITVASSSGAGIGGGGSIVVAEEIIPPPPVDPDDPTEPYIEYSTQGGNGGNIIINSGTVTARSTGGGSGIGGGVGGGAGNIRIKRDGNAATIVTARGGPIGGAGLGGGAGIAGGLYNIPGGSGDNIRIEGGLITATAGDSATPAIGNGRDGEEGIVSVSGEYDYWTNYVNVNNSETDAPKHDIFVQSGDTETFASKHGYSFIMLKPPTLPTNVEVHIESVVYGTPLGDPTARAHEGDGEFVFTYYGVLANGEPYASQDEQTDVKPSDPGEYFVVATFLSHSHEGQASMQFSITRLTLEWTEGKVKDKVYDEEKTAEIEEYPVFGNIVGRDEIEITPGEVEFIDAEIGTDKEIVIIEPWKWDAQSKDLWKYYTPHPEQPEFAPASITAAPTPTPEPSGTPTPSPSPAPSPSATPTPGPTATPTPTPLPPLPPPTPEPTPEPTPTLSPTPTPTPTPTPPEIRKPEVSPTPKPTPTPFKFPSEADPVIRSPNDPNGNVGWMSVEDWFSGEYGGINEINVKEPNKLIQILWLSAIGAGVLATLIAVILIKRRK